MPDYIYLLENRLSPGQQHALKVVRESAREAQMTVFLTGGAVRDLTSGSPVRDLDFSVQGNALKLKKALEKAGGIFAGEEELSHTVFYRFGGGARAEVSSTRQVTYPKPGKPVYQFANIHDDLRRRDFTANAMALSLNEGSYGLLMDPLNGVADIESRLLRLVSNYGFLERPSLLIRATRFAARLGWELEEKTLTRFENAKAEGIIDSLSDWHRGYELEEIGHEEDSLRILKVLEEAGWMKHLFPAWSSAKADVAGLDQLRDVLNQLQMQGVNPDTSTAAMTLLTAKLSPKELADLKKLLVRPGFVEEWNALDHHAKEFAKELTSKQMAVPSAAWKLLTSSNPEAVLWLSFTGKSAAIQEKFHNFFSVWPDARQKIPYTIMQEMRITPEIDGYQALLQNLFFELIDGRLQTEEQIRAFLEPFSPPAPPPPVTVRRTRGKKATEARAKAKMDDEESDELPEGDELKLDPNEEAEEEEIEEDHLIEAPAPRTLKPLKSTSVIQTEAIDHPAIRPKSEVKTAASASTKSASASMPQRTVPGNKILENKPAAKPTSTKPVPGKASLANASGKRTADKGTVKSSEKHEVVVTGKAATLKPNIHKSSANPHVPSKAVIASKSAAGKSSSKPAPPKPGAHKPAAKASSKSHLKAKPAAKASHPKPLAGKSAGLKHAPAKTTKKKR